MSKSRWNDLGERIGVGAVVALVGLACVWFGGFPFAALTVVASGVMVWELVRMLDPKAPAVLLAGLSAAALIVAEILPVTYALPLVIAPVFIGISQLTQRRLTFAVFTGLIILAGLGLYILRADFGFVWMLWLALVVIASDVFGYAFGRIIGGPKLWPRISPNKTWAGTVAGWIGAVIVGGGIAWWTGVGPEIVPVSIAVAMAAQIGDVAESAVKRRAGVKDSSSLLPGHGGLFDRFDGMLGASVFMLLTTPIIGFPPGTLA
ncbi:Phosphatidate cytidylyltransferase [Rhodobacteraceae bacterium THAF1]|uniref:phosphatidate cytidylyltransferase n=1 Tax=Palleronia sp. THAF1 TaxID=2587842 RepID=UPI000F4166CC|nr:phosphatidate cytidylyltransferase [Palleronia sp. THAF1]QFU08890.1 Phosphatidate cytidylyltransferase [Palleronia sp. THAF1]VDC24398.1 Phosphatidate cytidylyltransferase [Rhodobacteraceae bacterium THAF1]